MYETCFQPDELSVQEGDQASQNNLNKSIQVMDSLASHSQVPGQPSEHVKHVLSDKKEGKLDRVRTLIKTVSSVASM